MGSSAIEPNTMGLKVNKKLIILLSAAAVGVFAVVQLLLAHPWDRDGDGSWGMLAEPPDCDDGNANAYPGAEEIPLSGVDEDCDGFESYQGANIVLIVIDTLRFDHLGCYGYVSDTSPRLDRFSEQSVLFEKAYSHAPWTHPSVTSIMTSLHPNEHGVTQWKHRIKSSLITLPEVLHDAGYRTEAFVSHVLFRPVFGYRQGFDLYDFSVLDTGNPHKIATSALISDKAVAALQRIKGPFFLFLHYFDPHANYLHHEEFDFSETSDISRYNSEIAFTDLHIGRVLDEISNKGLLDKTIVVVVADHGEEFRDHGGTQHTNTLFEELIHIPLLVRVPWVRPERVDEVVVESDIAPTLLDLVGLPIPGQFKGKVIRFGLEGVVAENRTVFSETRRGANKKCIIRDGYKLILNQKKNRIRLYNLLKDPFERVNLVSREKKRGTALLSALLDFYKQSPESSQVIELSDELVERLESLGYVQ